MDWERARKPEQKAERSDAILNAARSLFSELEYEEISLNGIAREAGISKPNVYRYFSTREEIFLAIFEEEQAHFVRSLITRLKKIRAKDSVGAISRAWVEIALKNPTWLNLLPQLSNSMERNSSVDQLVHFKKIAYQRFSELVETLEQIYPRLDTQQWIAVVQCTFSMMAGLWPFSNPGENVVSALQHPDVNQAVWDFKIIMMRGMSALIKGTLAETKG